MLMANATVTIRQRQTVSKLHFYIRLRADSAREIVDRVFVFCQVLARRCSRACLYVRRGAAQLWRRVLLRDSSAAAAGYSQASGCACMMWSPVSAYEWCNSAIAAARGPVGVQDRPLSPRRGQFMRHRNNNHL